MPDFDNEPPPPIRKNIKPITVIAYKDRVEDLQNSENISYVAKWYNTPIITSKSIKKPYYCPKGKSNCKLCSEERHNEQNKKNYNIFVKYEVSKDNYTLE
jgi:hypothetical protein